jgi:hypothetical protein
MIAMENQLLAAASISVLNIDNDQFKNTRCNFNSLPEAIQKNQSFFKTKPDEKIIIGYHAMCIDGIVYKNKLR